MAFNVSDFRANLSGGGARPTLFEVVLTNPVAGLGDQKLTFTCKAAQLPPSTKGTIEVPYFGRKIKVAGDRTFPEWTVTIINDEDFVVRHSLELWCEAINGKESNLAALGANPNSYKGTKAQVRQFGKAGNLIRSYSFDGIFPAEIAAIDLAWDTNDTLEEFQVTFAYDFWVLDTESPIIDAPLIRGLL